MLRRRGNLGMKNVSIFTTCGRCWFWGDGAGCGVGQVGRGGKEREGEEVPVRPRTRVTFTSWSTVLAEIRSGLMRVERA